jgi:hypothetical protein
VTKAIQTVPLPAETNASIPASTNPAVVHCCEAYSRARKAALAQGKGNIFAVIAGDQAYRNAMPQLSDYESIRDFIACTAHAIATDVIVGPLGPRLLYAAQVALSAVRCQPAPRKSVS